jgi:hypothetical protein
MRTQFFYKNQGYKLNIKIKLLIYSFASDKKPWS